MVDERREVRKEREGRSWIKGEGGRRGKEEREEGEGRRRGREREGGEGGRGKVGVQQHTQLQLLPALAQGPVKQSNKEVTSLVH